METVLLVPSTVMTMMLLYILNWDTEWWNRSRLQWFRFYSGYRWRWRRIWQYLGLQWLWSTYQPQCYWNLCGWNRSRLWWIWCCLRSVRGTERFELTEIGQAAGVVLRYSVEYSKYNSINRLSWMSLFQIGFTYDANNSTIDPNGTVCSAYATNFSYNMATSKTTMVLGMMPWSGEILRIQLGLWFTNGDLTVSNGAPCRELQWSQFTYSTGYHDYLYQGNYFTNAVSGSDRSVSFSQWVGSSK